MYDDARVRNTFVKDYCRHWVGTSGGLGMLRCFGVLERWEQGFWVWAGVLGV